ncbi:MAG: PEGA domain-containing protein, partial [Deltaproteobacteria bacterium]|nr:PEGA domain-containing protein [Deltaproteobacteria bacterium]
GNDRPLLSLFRLQRILGLGGAAAEADLARRTRHLIDRLERERSEADGDRRDALDREIETLRRSADYWTGVNASGPDGAREDEAPSHADRPRIRAALFLATLALLGVVALAAFVSGFRITRLPAEPELDAATTGRLIVESRPKGSELRVRPPEGEELLLKVPAEGVRLELKAGLYRLEVAREDCPDRWEEAVELRAGETRRFEPEICRGEGRLIVRSNVSEDRLRIDGYDLGATGPEPLLLGVGDHDVRVEKQGYRPFEGRIRVEPDARLELRAELVALDPGASGASAGARPLPVARQAPSRPPPVQGIEPPKVHATPPDFEGDLDLDLGRLPNPLPSRLMRAEDARGTRLRGGTTTWHDAISRQMLARFDTDGSGSIDRVEESEAISCELWQEVERDFDEGGLGLSLAHNYGFDGSEWIEGALGFSRTIRSAVYDKMKECGLRP